MYGHFYKPRKNYESMKRFHPSFSGMLSLLAAALLTACTSEPYDTSGTASGPQTHAFTETKPRKSWST